MSSLHLSFLVAWMCLFKYGQSEVPMTDFFNYTGTYVSGDSVYDGSRTPSLYAVVYPPFTYFGYAFDSLHLSLYGAVTLNGEMYYSATPSCQAQYRNWYTIAPYWIQTSSVGNMTWRYTTTYGDPSANDTEIEKARKDIITAFPAYRGIKLKWLGVATWLNMQIKTSTYNYTTNKRSFATYNVTTQAALTTDGAHSFVIFYYNRVDYPYESDFFSGFDDSKSLNSNRYPIASSCPEVTRNVSLTEESNIGSPGKWVFRVDKSSIIGPGSLCPALTAPSDGYCQVSDFTLGSEAVCGCRGNSQDLKPARRLKARRKILCVDGLNGLLEWAGYIPDCKHTNSSNSQGSYEYHYD